MLISLRELIEGAIAIERASKRLTGDISDWDALYDPANLALLDNEHDGIFAFLAFHPTADAATREYVAEGTLASDSGPYIWVFYTLDADATRGRRETKVAGLRMDSGQHPAYEAVRLLFEPGSPPPLPGILFVPEMFGPADVVFVPLAGQDDASATRAFLRTVLTLAEQAWRKGGREEFPARFGTALQAKRIAHQRRERASAREWLIRGYQYAVDHGSEIVTTIGGLTGA